MAGVTVSVSVLTPIYNVERYLRQCLDSLIAQDLPGSEFICLNDGSTDGSLAIVEEYAERDSRIRVIDKPNSGYGATMNRGLDEARGDYIAIVESDDFIESAFLRRLHGLAVNHDCDLVKCNYFEHWGGRDHRRMNFKGFPYGKRFDPVSRPRIVCTIPAIWTALYRRSMLEEEGIRFRETPGASFQDTGFTLKAWFASRSCVLDRGKLLHYRMDNPNSSSVAVSEKPFAVLDELSDAEGFLRRRPERAQGFLPWFFVDKLGKCRWCYERIVPERRREFIELVRDGYGKAQAAGELEVGCFSATDRKILFELMEESPQAFVANHPDRF